jgi:chemotaxis protein MotB
MNDAKDMNLEEEGIIISSDANGATLEMTSLSLFDKGSVILKPEAFPVIQKISLLLKSNKYKKYRIVVEGHTDDTNESETLPSNWELSGARAGAVVRAMIGNEMDINRFKAVGMAEISPAYPNKNPYGEPIPENRIKNRRVVVRIEF